MTVPGNGKEPEMEALNIRFHKTWSASGRDPAIRWPARQLAATSGCAIRYDVPYHWEVKT
jgi:hypothetical protein